MYAMGHFWIMVPSAREVDSSGLEIKDDEGRVWRQVTDKVGHLNATASPALDRPIFHGDNRTVLTNTPTQGPSDSVQDVGLAAYKKARNQGMSHSAAQAAAMAAAKEKASGADEVIAAKAGVIAARAEFQARKAGFPKAKAQQAAVRVAQKLLTGAPQPRKQRTSAATTGPSTAYQRFTSWISQHQTSEQPTWAPSKLTTNQHKRVKSATLIPTAAQKDSRAYIDHAQLRTHRAPLTNDQEGPDDKIVSYDAAKSFASSALHFLHAGSKNSEASRSTAYPENSVRYDSAVSPIKPETSRKSPEEFQAEGQRK